MQRIRYDCDPSLIIGTPQERVIDATSEALCYVSEVLRRNPRTTYNPEGLVREALELRAVKSLPRGDRETVRDAVSLVLKLR